MQVIIQPCGVVAHLVSRVLYLIHHAIVISLLVEAVYPGECPESIKVGKAPLDQSIPVTLTLLVNLEVLSDRGKYPSVVSFLWNNSLAKSFNSQVNPRLKFLSQTLKSTCSFTGIYMFLEPVGITMLSSNRSTETTS